MDEYAAGVTAGFKTNAPKLNRCLELLGWLKEDSEKLAAADLHELMRCHENIQRMYQAECHARTMLFREETRWPGYYFRSDFPKMDEANWKCFVNCTYKGGNWEFKKVPVLSIVD
jgi:adenylylsulfate reductase, subunit A